MLHIHSTLLAATVIVTRLLPCLALKKPFHRGDAEFYSSCKKCPWPCDEIRKWDLPQKVTLFEDPKATFQEWTYKVNNEEILGVVLQPAEKFKSLDVTEHFALFTGGAQSNKAALLANQQWIFQLQSNVAGARVEYYYLTGAIKTCDIGGLKTDLPDHPLDTYTQITAIGKGHM